MNFTNDEQYPWAGSKAIIRCSRGHEFSVDNLLVTLEEIGSIEFECNECYTQGKESEIRLLSEQCAKNNCHACPDDGFMLCDCFCHDDAEYFLRQLINVEQEEDSH